MSYRIGLVEMRNFGPFAGAEIDLDYPGVTVIEGLIEGVPGCDSNGAGKSFIFDAVAWCLYGRCIRPDYKADDIVKLDGDKLSKGGTFVRVTLNGGPDPVTVERYRRHPMYKNQLRLLVDGDDVSRGTDVQTELAIERKLGMDFVTFCNSVAFGVREDVKSFFFASDTERKKVLDTLLGMELYSEAEKVAKRSAKEIAQEVYELEDTATRLRTKHETKQESLDDSLTDAEIARMEVQYKEHKVKLKVLDKKAKPLKQEIESLQEEYDTVEDEITKQRKEWSKRYDEYKKEKQDVDAQRAKADSSLAFARSQVKRAKERIEKSKNMAGTECPTCEQKVQKTHINKVVKAYRSDLKEYELQVEQFEEEVEECDAKLTHLAPPDVIDDEPLRKIEKKIDTLSAKRGEIRAERKGLVSVIEQLQERIDEAQSNKSGLQDELDKLAEELLEVEQEIKAKNKDLARYEFWVSAFGNRGLKSFLIEAEVPEINKHATKYAQKLLGHGSVVRLSATSTLKSGAKREKLSVSGVIPGYTKSYSGASKGQKKRMDLSLLLAFRRLVANRADRAIDQVFADEIFDGVDQSGVEQVGELLREEANNGPVVLVTHDPRLKPVGDRFVTVRNVDHTATIEIDKASKKPAKKKKPATKLKRAKRARRRGKKAVSARGT